MIYLAPKQPPTFRPACRISGKHIRQPELLYPTYAPVSHSIVGSNLYGLSVRYFSMISNPIPCEDVKKKKNYTGKECKQKKSKRMQKSGVSSEK